jgi:hypothetical protein
VGFVWRLFSKTGVTHYLVGTCHDARIEMMSHPGLIEAAQKGKAYYSEDGELTDQELSDCDALSVSRGYDLTMDAALTRRAMRSGLSTHKLDLKEHDDQIIENLRHNQALQEEFVRLLPVHAVTWNLGDEEDAIGLQAQLAEPFLCFARNELWLQRLVPIMREALISIVVDVGYLHTVGPRGLLAGFQEAGFGSERIRSAEGDQSIDPYDFWGLSLLEQEGDALERILVLC